MVIITTRKNIDFPLFQWEPEYVRSLLPDTASFQYHSHFFKDDIEIIGI